MDHSGFMKKVLWVINCAHTIYESGGEHALAMLDVHESRIPQNANTSEKDTVSSFGIVIGGAKCFSTGDPMWGHSKYTWSTCPSLVRIC